VKPSPARHKLNGDRRREAVTGAVKGAKTGPTGAARGAAKAVVKRPAARPSAPSSTARPSRARRAARATGGYAAKRGKGLAIKRLEGPVSGALFAEYFAGIFVIFIGVFTKAPTEGYLAVMPKIMIRLTALTAVFFVLFLMQGSKRGAQAAVWFGLLVDLGIVFTAAKSQTFSTTADIISGKGMPVQTLGAKGDGTGNQPSALTVPPEPEGVQLPDVTG